MRAQHKEAPSIGLISTSEPIEISPLQLWVVPRALRLRLEGCTFPAETMTDKGGPRVNSWTSLELHMKTMERIKVF